MENKMLRVIVVLAICSMCGVIVTQFYWIKKAMLAQDSEFDTKVSSSLRNVAESLIKYSDGGVIALPVIRKSADEYVVKINRPVSPNLLEALLQREFLAWGIAEHHDVRIFDCIGKKVIYENCSAGMNHKTENKDIGFLYENYFFDVRFPGKKNDLSRIWLWLGTTIIVVFMFGFFAYLIYLFFRQKKISETQKDFVNNMTHEFKTPLTSIALAAQVLRKESQHQDNSRGIQYAEIIVRESDRLEKNVQRILQMGYAGNHGIQLCLENLDVHVQIVKSMEKFSNVHKDCTFIPKFSALNSVVKGDAFHLGNILDNLIDNAIKYSNDAAVVKLETSNKEGGIYISVEDHGQGIAKEYTTKIFDNFYRIPQGNIHTTKGFGVGLYYVKRMIKEHGGYITLKSKPGIGSQFLIHLPLIK